MAEILQDNTVKTIAFYLPQFHAIPENDKAWGEGFTEWNNTQKAIPLFDGHYQPKIPLGKNYYNLLDDNIKIWQATLAKKYGIFGFCYYHYWFKNGKKLLEKPAEQMLKNKEINIPFCFSWANENWSKRWDGGESEVICEQDYGNEQDWKMHLDYFLPFFKDSRYITYDGKPVLLIYKPEIIPDINRMLCYWEKAVKKMGFNGICFMIQNSSWYYTPTYELGKFDFQIKFQPFYTILGKQKDKKILKRKQSIYHFLCKIGLKKASISIISKVKRKRSIDQSNNQQLIKLNYDEMWELILKDNSDSKMIECAFPDWDNTARKKNGYVHLGSTPEKFGKYMSQLIRKVQNSQAPNIIFINAWNEWGEGAYLEPDEKFQYSYLEAFSKALSQTENKDLYYETAKN